MNSMMTSPEVMAKISETKAKGMVRTQYVVRVAKVSSDGRFVKVVHSNLEWRAGIDGDEIILNELGVPVLASPTKPWVINDVPVEQPYLRGQWQINARPRVGDYGILSVFYHDIDTWKQKGGFQAPGAIRIHALDSCSFRPGLPNHKDVNEEQTTYPSDDVMEIKGNGVSVKFTAPNNDESEADKKIDITVGAITINIVAPAEGNPVMTISSPTINITGDLNITGDVNTTGTITATTDVIGGGVSLKNHVHPFPYNAGPTPAEGTTEIPTPSQA